MLSILAALLYFGTLLSFAASVNIGALAVRKYTVANKLFEEEAGAKYGGPLPEHIWKTALGTVFLIVAVALHVFRGGVPDTVDIELVFSFLGFFLLALGMWELLNFERGRVRAQGFATTLRDRHTHGLVSKRKRV